MRAAIWVLWMILLLSTVNAAIIDEYTEQTCERYNSTHELCTAHQYAQPVFIDCHGWKNASDAIKVELVDDMLSIKECDKETTYRLFTDGQKGKKYIDGLSFFEGLSYNYRLNTKAMPGGVAWEINFTDFPRDVAVLGFELQGQGAPGLKQQLDKSSIDWTDAEKLGYKTKIVGKSIEYTELPIVDESLYFHPVVTLTGASMINDTSVVSKWGTTNLATEASYRLANSSTAVPTPYSAYVLLQTKQTVANISAVVSAWLYLRHGCSATSNVVIANAINCSTSTNISNITWNTMSTYCGGHFQMDNSTLNASGWVDALNVTTVFKLNTSPYILLKSGAGNESVGCIYSTEGVGYPPYIELTYTAPGNFTIYAYSNLTGAAITAFNATIDGVSYGTIDGSLETNLSYATVNKTVVVWATAFDNLSATVEIDEPYNVSLDAARVSLYLINERNGSLFDVTRVTGAKAYDDSNHTLYNFKTTNSSGLNYTITNSTRIRIELEYSDGSIVNRYLDLAMLGIDTVRVCANEENTTHYNAYIESGYQKPVTMLSVYADCYVIGDYTRFAYQNGYLVRGYTIPTHYYLYTEDDDGATYLIAGLDGSINHEIQLDNLEFLRNTYTTEDYQDIVSFVDMDDDVMNNTISIKYTNIANDNTGVNIQILMDTTLLFNSSSFGDANDITIYFDYSAYNATSETVFTLSITPAGKSTITKYFTVGGQTAQLPSGLVILVSIVITIFSLTLASTSLTFGWFGILIEVLNLSWLGFGTDSPYRTWLIGLNVIVLLAMIIISIKGADTPAGGTT